MVTKLKFVQSLGTKFKILKLKFSRDYEAEVWLVFAADALVEVMKFNLGQDSDSRFGQDLFTFCLVEMLIFS